MKAKNTKFLQKFMQASINSIGMIDQIQLMKAGELLKKLKTKKGRLFIIGSGGGAGHASHAVNDFRKIAEIESYCPSDNTSELTARINDEGWDTCYSEWLKISKINCHDVLLVFSVGGGCSKRKISMNLVNAMKLANSKSAKIIAVTGRDGGASKKLADILILIPVKFKKIITPVVEALQALVWHCLVSLPDIQSKKTKW